MSELHNQRMKRREKLRKIKELGFDPFPTKWNYDYLPHEVHERYSSLDRGSLSERDIRCRVVGRIIAKRGHGKLIFIDVSSGKDKLQFFIRKNNLSAKEQALLKLLDIGDFIGAEGKVIRTKTGELSLEVFSLVIISKSLRPLPEKWHGLADVETRYRQRYIDILVSNEVRQIFDTRYKILFAIRSFLNDKGFIEVETPMLHTLATGAAAKPFVTHHNALDIDLYLRIAPELFLKRLVVGGFDKVYEIGRNFRNEGVSTKHNPEFTMLELYWAYKDYEDIMDFTQEIIVHVLEKVIGQKTVKFADLEIDFSTPWNRVSLKDSLIEMGGLNRKEIDSVESAKRICERLGLEIPEDYSYGEVLVALFEELVADKLVNPTFITLYPVEVSPLAKRDPYKSGFAQRFELYIGGMEIANAFSELNDPLEQANRFKEQLAKKKEGFPLDADYLRALEIGLPPTGGLGIGIDRLTMVLTGQISIREVILFPLLKPKQEEDLADIDGLI